MSAQTLAPPRTELPSASAETGRETERWTAELITTLDWRRLTEIVRAMASFSAFSLGPTTLEADATTDFTMTHGLNGSARCFLVRLAPWNNWVATGDCMESFARDLATFHDAMGIYIAPLGFSPSALRVARRSQIELVDGAMLAARLNQLPDEHSAFYHEVGTAGDASTPSCPVCLSRLVHKEGDILAPPSHAELPDISYRSNDLVAEPVAARRLEIVGGCEVHFLHGVRARDIIVHGVAIGNFVCDGIVLLNPGARLYGSVAARSVLVRPGAEMHGETRILQGTPEPIQISVREWVWCCRSPAGTEACRSVSLLPH